MLETIVGIMVNVVKIVGLGVLAGCGLISISIIALVIIKMFREGGV